MQDGSISSANALEILQFCTKPSILWFILLPWILTTDQLYQTAKPYYLPCQHQWINRPGQETWGLSQYKDVVLTDNIFSVETYPKPNGNVWLQCSLMTSTLVNSCRCSVLKFTVWKFFDAKRSPVTQTVEICSWLFTPTGIKINPY